MMRAAEGFQGRSDMDEVQMKTLYGTILAACLGGVVHWMRHPKGGYTVFAFLVSICTAAFVGMQAHFIMRWMGFAEELQFAVAGAVGYGGGALLDAAVPMMIRYGYKRLGLEFPEPRRRASDREDTEEDNVEE